MISKNEEVLIEKLKILFEIGEKKKINLNFQISKFVDLDSLNQLKLMGFIDENGKKKLNLNQISKLKKFKDIIKLIND